MSDEAVVLLGKLIGYGVIGYFFTLFRRGRAGIAFGRILVWLFLVPTTLLILSFAVRGGLVAIAAFGLTGLLWFGGPVAARLATPAGLPRVASTLAALGSLPYRSDPRGLGSIAEARTCLVLRNRRQAIPERPLLRLERRIATTKVLRPGTVVARAYCCLVLGDREQARLLFKSVGDFAPSLRGGTPQVVAARWLVADAASQGDWTALQALPNRLNTTLTRFAAACATRINEGPRSVTKARLLDRWLVTSSRFATLPLLRMAWSAAERERSVNDAPLLARHVAALRGHATPTEILDLATAWQAEIDQLTQAGRAAVLDDLFALANKVPELRGRHAFFSREHGDALRAFEIAAQALARRLEDERWLPPIEEWLEIAMLRDLYEELVVDPARRRVGFDALRHLITNYAAALFNVRKQKPVANALFLWMEREARWAQDEEILKINKKNIACGV